MTILSFIASVTAPVKVRVSRSLRDCGVLIPHPKWDKSLGLFSCELVLYEGLYSHTTHTLTLVVYCIVLD